MPQSIWIQDDPRTRFPALDRDLVVDVVVVGGGITGVTAAYLIKKAGLSVALLERNHCGDGETGYTTAHLTYVTDVRPSELVKTFGLDHARAAWDAGQAAIHQIHENIDAEGLDCDFGWVPGYLHAAWNQDAEDERHALQEDACAAIEMGFDASFMEAVPFVGRPAVRFPNVAQFQPLKYIAGLSPLIVGQGSHVFENANVDEVTDEPLGVRVGGYRVHCGFVVIATHVPLMGNAGLVSATFLQSKLAPYSTYALGARLPLGTVPAALFWDTADPYYYLRVHRRRELGSEYGSEFDWAIFGGEDHKTGQQEETQERYGRLERLLLAILPQAQITARWSGQVVETNDGLPFIGETAKGQFAATGFSGNGMTFGTLGGIMARDAALGQANPWSKLFDPRRTKIRGGAWDYLRENLDYPYYMLKDRLTAAEGESPECVGRGEGKILKIAGRKMAVSRDENGELACVSAICTHMGCLVHWNKAEQTWDCPCHGSRFKPDGKVLAGPAESPLEPQHVEVQT